MVKVIRPVPRIPNTPVRRPPPSLDKWKPRWKEREPLGYDEFGNPYYNPRLSDRWTGPRMAERRPDTVFDETTTQTPKQSQDLKEQSKSAQQLEEDFNRGSSTRTRPFPWGPWPSTVPDPELPGEGDPFEPSEDIETPDVPPDDIPDDPWKDKDSKDEEEDDSWQNPPIDCQQLEMLGIPCTGNASLQISSKTPYELGKNKAYSKSRLRHTPRKTSYSRRGSHSGRNRSRLGQSRSDSIGGMPRNYGRRTRVRWNKYSTSSTIF